MRSLTESLSCTIVPGLALAVSSSAAPAADTVIIDGPPRAVVSQFEDLVGPVQQPDGSIHVAGQVFPSWEAYFASDYFRDNGLRCAFEPGDDPADGGSASDCAYTFTNPSDVYAPSIVKYRIQVVVHVIRTSAGTTGHVPMGLVESQIDILNEDFLALPGTLGGDGTDVQIEFYLATEDPDGAPTTGVTYSNNTTWYNDSGGYYNSLAWDPHRYLNIYTNSAGGALGYVPFLPQSGSVGSNADRVVIYWAAFGRDAPIGFPYHKGRTATHEVGHYLGLWHVFNNGCGTASCYSSGDYICDTPPTATPTSTCGGSSCSTPDAYDNYMDYSYDTCMERFTPEQARRIRCTLEWYRPNLPQDACDENGGDNNGDGIVDTADLLAVLSDWGCTGTCDADSNCDGVVDTADLLIVLANWT